MAYLVVHRQGQELCRLQLDGPLTIGRQVSCDLWLPDPRVSREHCRIEPSGSRWVVRDLGSRNGVYVGGRKVEAQELNDGAQITVGDATITFHAVGFVNKRPAKPQVGDSDVSAMTQYLMADVEETKKSLPRPVIHPTQASPSDRRGKTGEVAIKLGNKPNGGNSGENLALKRRHRPARPQPSVQPIIEPPQGKAPIVAMMDSGSAIDSLSRRGGGLHLGEIWTEQQTGEMRSA